MLDSFCRWQRNRNQIQTSQEKSPFTYLDTHAGRGMYDLVQEDVTQPMGRVGGWQPNPDGPADLQEPM